MFNVCYKVGTNGYYTYTKSYKDALKQKEIAREQGIHYTIETIYEKIAEPLLNFGFGVKATSRSAYEKKHK